MNCCLAQTAQLVTELLNTLPKDFVNQLTVLFADESSTAAAKLEQQHAKRKWRAINLNDAFVKGTPGYLMIVEPTTSQVWRPCSCVIFNDLLLHL